jgi:methionyl-tRNA formyltransferase
MRLIALCVQPTAYKLISHWALKRNSELALVVTSPGPQQDRAEAYRKIVAAAPHDQDILVTNNMSRLASVIRPLQIDLIVSCTFPHRVPADVISLPRLGAFNLHPAPLPHYRGPNPSRMIYDGHPTLGASFHRMSQEFDAGPVLSRYEQALPRMPSLETVWETWKETIVAAFYEGMERAIAGDPGEIQDQSASTTYAAKFSPTDRLLDWTLPGRSILLRWIGLTLFGPGATAVIGSDTHDVLLVDFFEAPQSKIPPGTVIENRDGEAAVSVKNGIVRLKYARSET